MTVKIACWTSPSSDTPGRSTSTHRGMSTNTALVGVRYYQQSPVWAGRPPGSSRES